MNKDFSNSEFVAVNDNPPELPCCCCKYLKSYFSATSNTTTINCKKGYKVILSGKPFCCGEFKYKKIKGENK